MTSSGSLHQFIWLVCVPCHLPSLLSHLSLSLSSPVCFRLRCLFCVGCPHVSVSLFFSSLVFTLVPCFFFSSFPFYPAFALFFLSLPHQLSRKSLTAFSRGQREKGPLVTSRAGSTVLQFDCNVNLCWQCRDATGSDDVRRWTESGNVGTKGLLFPNEILLP